MATVDGGVLIGRILKEQNVQKSLKPIAGMGFGVLYGRFSQKKKVRKHEKNAWNCPADFI